MVSIGEIANKLGVPIHRVRYIIDKRGIRPTGRIANVRTFAESDIQFIESELRRIAGDREGTVS